MTTLVRRSNRVLLASRVEPTIAPFRDAVLLIAATITLGALIAAFTGAPVASGTTAADVRPGEVGLPL